MWGAYALDVGCICTGSGMHMHWMWGAYALGVGCICTPLGCICARSETQTLMLALTLIEMNCVQHYPMTQLCSSELDLPFVFLIVSCRCQKLFATLPHWCICAPSPVHMHPTPSAYAPEVILAVLFLCLRWAYTHETNSVQCIWSVYAGLSNAR